MSNQFNTWRESEGYKFKPLEGGFLFDIRSQSRGREGASCEAGGHICGLQVKNLPFQGIGGAQIGDVSIDDAAIVGLRVKCCFP